MSPRIGNKPFFKTGPLIEITGRNRGTENYLLERPIFVGGLLIIAGSLVIIMF